MNCIKFLLALVLLFEYGHGEEFAYFDKSSCVLREPVIKQNLIEVSSLDSEINVSRYVIYLNSNLLDQNQYDNQSWYSLMVSFNNPHKIQSVLVQAIDARTQKPVGKWVIDDDHVKDITLLDCSHHQDTLTVNYGSNLINEFKWTLDSSDLSQWNDDESSTIHFIATVIGSDGKYSTEVKSESVKIEHNNVIASVVSPLSAAAQTVEKKSRAKRNIAKHFEESTLQCGSRKSCYVSLKTCDTDPKTCNFVLSWEYDGHLVNYELTGLSHAWISVVLSQDTYFGDDNIIVCARNPETNQLSIDHYFKRKDETQLYKLEPDYLENKFITFNQLDGYIYCKFSRAKTSDSRYVTDLSQPHYVYIERGAPGEVIPDKLNAFQPSETRIEFANTIYVPTSPRSWLVKVHAILGIIAWIFLAAIGILLARYYKPLWPNHVLYHFRVWFSFHRSIMIFVTLLTLISFLFALIELDWTWSLSGHDLLHATLGIIVIVCACINPILGFFRPSPTSPMRCLFFWIHWLVGVVAFCLAVPAIFIGMDLSKSDLPNWCSWLLFFWVLFHIVVEIILEIHYCCTFSQLQGNLHEKNLDYDRINKIPIKKNNPPGYRWKPTLLFFYALITAIVVSALVIAILLLDV